MFSGDVGMDHQLEMGEDNNWRLYYLNYHFEKVKVTE